mmetsp:Transcript_4071/g.6023  ORF Transcript_4071/g.6023 Transcript_4071/m.6023 type:complete len:242 (+) Transcript_4071:156-881(+)
MKDKKYDEEGCSSIIIRFENVQNELLLEFDDISSSQIAHTLNLNRKDMLYLRIDGMKDTLTGTIYSFKPTLTEETRFEGVEQLRPGATYEILIHDVREDYVAQLVEKEITQVKELFEACANDNGILNIDKLMDYYDDQCIKTCKRYELKLQQVIKKSPENEEYHKNRYTSKCQQAKEKAETYKDRYKELGGGNPITYKTFLAHSAMIILSEKRQKQHFKRVISTTCVTPTSPSTIELKATT